MSQSDRGLGGLRATPPPRIPPVQSTPTTRVTNGPPDGLDKSSDVQDDLKLEIKPCTSTQGIKSPWVGNIYKYLEIDDASAKRLLADPALEGEHLHGKWKNIPSMPKLEDDKLYDALVKLLNKIIQIVKADGNFHGDRRAIKTASIPQAHEETHRPFGPAPPRPARVFSKPDILIVGQDDRFLPDALADTVTSEEFRHAIVVGDVKLDTTTKDGRIAEGPNDQDTRSQIVLYARQCLIQQGNRFFMFAFVITPTQFRLMMIDHSGVLESKWINYHKHPENLIKFAWLVGGWNLEKMGFDRSIYYEKEAGNIQRFIDVTFQALQDLKPDGTVDTTPNPAPIQVRKYRILGVSYREPGVFGSATVCWDVEEVGADKEEVLTIKDYWRHPLRQHEAVLLREAEASGAQGIIRLIIFEYEPEDVKEKRSTQNARLLVPKAMKSNDGTPFVDLVHTRIVTEQQVSIVNFESRLQFLQAFRGAISAHLSLLEEYELLHRKINLNTMLLGNSGSESGLLGDLSMAVKVTRGPEDALLKKDFLSMSWTFLSYNLLAPYASEDFDEALSKCDHNVVDELESLSYALMWVTHEFIGPRARVSKRNAYVVDMEHQNPVTSRSGKKNLFHTATDGVDIKGVHTGVTTYFRQPSIMKLYRSLCTIVYTFSREKGLLLLEDKKLAVESSNTERRKVYKQILDLIAEAIKEFGDSKEGKEEKEAMEAEAAALAEVRAAASDPQAKASVAEPDAPAQPAGEANGDAQALKRKKSFKKPAANPPRVGLRRSMRNLRIAAQASDGQEEGSGGKRKQAPAKDEDEETLKKAKMDSESVASDE